MTSAPAQGRPAPRPHTGPSPRPRPRPAWLADLPVRVLLPLSFVYLGVGLATAMAMPYLTLFLTDEVKVDGTRQAVFLAASPVAAVLANTLFGRLSDRLPSRRGLMVVTALLGGAGACANAFSRDYWVLLAVAVTLTASGGTLMSQMFAYSREVLDGHPQVALTISALRSIFSLAWVAGPPVAAVVLAGFSFTGVWSFSAVLYLLSALTVLATPRRHAATAPADAAGPGPAPACADPADVVVAQGLAGDTDADTDARVPAVHVPRLLLWSTLAAFVLARCAGNLSVQALSLYTTRELHGTVANAGLLLGVCAALEIPLMLGLGVLSAKVPLQRLLVIGAVCGVAYMGLAVVATDLWQLVLGQLLNATVIAATTGLGITYVQDLVPGSPGRGSALFANTFAVGNVLAGPVLGAAQEFGYRMPFAVGLGMCVAATGLLMVGRGRAASPVAG